MDNLKDSFLKALREAISRHGSQTKLASFIGMQQSRISDYLSERYDLDNITIGTLRKIFPELQLSYFYGEERAESSTDLELERQVLDHFKALSSADKARYAMLVAAHFPDWIMDTKKQQ